MPQPLRSFTLKPANDDGVILLPDLEKAVQDVMRHYHRDVQQLAEGPWLRIVPHDGYLQLEYGTAPDPAPEETTA